MFCCDVIFISISWLKPTWRIDCEKNEVWLCWTHWAEHCHSLQQETRCLTQNTFLDSGSTAVSTLILAVAIMGGETGGRLRAWLTVKALRRSLCHGCLYTFCWIIFFPHKFVFLNDNRLITLCSWMITRKKLVHPLSWIVVEIMH